MPRITHRDSDDDDAAATATLVGTIKAGPDPAIRRILVTGAAGFIASWVARHLALTYSSSYHIVCFDILDYCATQKNLSCLVGSRNFSFVHGDITNELQVVSCLRQHGIDTILHFAALSDVDRSFGNAEAYTQVNVVGTQVLLEAATRCGVTKFIHMSTDEVEGDQQRCHGSTCHFQPTNPYAASKAAAEMYVRAYANAYRLPCVIVRSNNVYGPCQFPEKIIPRFMTLLSQGKSLEIHGTGLNRRHYVYASDAADAIDTIMHKGKVGHIYCITSPDELSNDELAREILALFDVPPQEMPRRITYVQDRQYNDHAYMMKSHELETLGWAPRVRFEQGVRKTKDWYERYGAGWWSAEWDSKHNKACALSETHGKARL